MHKIHLASAAVIAIFACSPVFTQTGGQGLSIVNYQVVNRQSASGTRSYVTYRADLKNSGNALGLVIATLSTLDPYSIRTLPGQDTLHFASSPGNSQVTSADTFTILVDTSVPFDSTKLQWTFQITSQGPLANPGPNQSAAVGSLVTLNGSGSTNSGVAGTLTYSWSFTSRPAGTSARLMNSSNVIASFVPDVQGTYIVTLTVSAGNASSSADVTIASDASPPPVANAGPNQTVSVGATVVLNGSASTSGGGPLTYSWTLPNISNGSAAALTGAKTMSPTFVADKPGMYVAQLVVNDGTRNSAPSFVTISTQISKPVANAGSSQIAIPGTLVQLNGAGSTDVNGKPLTYKWSLIALPSGSTATLNNPSIVNPIFTTDLLGTYVAQLVVNNGTLDSDPATVPITTFTGAPPIANAGPNQTVALNSVALLNGSGIDPRPLPLTYKWTLLSKPAGSSAALSNSAIANPTLVADAIGNFVAQLVVNDAYSASNPSTVTISTTCAQPMANAGHNQSVSVGANVTLDASASGDVCHDPLTYSWTFTTRPNGSAAALSGANTSTPSFVADMAGIYVAQLIVSNGLASIPATVSITAGSAPGITLTDGVTIGQYLQVKGMVSVGQVPASGLDVTVTANNLYDLGLDDGGPKRLLISPGPTTVGASTITVHIPAGLTSAPFYLQALDGLGTITYTATSPGIVSVTATVSFAPSGLVISGPQGLNSPSFTASLSAGGSTPITVNTAQLDPYNYNFVAVQQLGAGRSVTASLGTGDFSVGTVTSQVTIAGGFDTGVAQFTPQLQGSTTIKVYRTVLFLQAGNNTSVTANVVQ